MSATEYQEDLHAELGYRTAGRRELAQREWYSLRGEAGEAAPTPKTFDALVNRLRVKKWALENPERRNEIANRYAAKPRVKSIYLAQARSRRRARLRQQAEVFVCVECGVQWCRVPGTYRGGARPKFCTSYCANRNLHIRKSPGARRHGRHTRLTPIQRETICARYAAGERAADLAKEFGISRRHVNALWRAAARAPRGSSGAELGGDVDG